MSGPRPRAFAARVLDWFDRHGRHDLPWQHPRAPYRVWLAEVMLQQTQVATAIPYFERFVARFPDLRTLAAAPLDDVLALWSGLGYYSRARNLHRAALLCIERHGGELPKDFEALLALPGIGRSTAGAIAAQAFGLRHAILDGNVKRVLARHRGVTDDLSQAPVLARLWDIAESLLPERRLADHTQAMMDLGATVCLPRAPRCADCPIARDCIAHRDGLVDAIPATRRRAGRPTRTAYWLLLIDDLGRVQLERRPPSGIWGGLWAPPAFDDRALLGRAAADAGARALDDLPPFGHAFTHFRLEVRPVRARVERPGRIGDHHTGWFAIDEALALGLPAPVRTLLRALAEPANPECDPADGRTPPGGSERTGDPTCHEPSTAAASAARQKRSTSRRGPGRSGSASSPRSASPPGTSGSRTRRC
jgi:A/G-specific adenine glycosylase